MKQFLKNGVLSVEIDSHGAEIQSIINVATGYQYLWQGDKAFWGRRSPVLFPLVGQVWQGKYRLDGNEFALGQHGFARDRDFEVMDCEADDEAWFCLESDEESLKVFPRRFRLEIGYRLNEERIDVMWRVVNLDERALPFHIGAHPAFNYPDFSAADEVHAYLAFGARGLSSQKLAEGGCVGADTYPVELDADGMMPVKADTFRYNTIILADPRVRRVSMLDKERRPYITVLFDSPLVGVWSPNAQAPFICIEPWWGRADRVGYDGDFDKREYINLLGPGKTFEASYMIIFENV